MHKHCGAAGFSFAAGSAHRSPLTAHHSPLTDSHLFLIFSVLENTTANTMTHPPAITFRVGFSPVTANTQTGFITGSTQAIISAANALTRFMP
jgi:hypothetical protein